MPPHRKIAVAGVALAILLAFTAFRPPSTPGPLERDFEAYYAAGSTVNARGDPYSRTIWTAERRIPGVSADRDELLPFVGPAAALPFWSVLARLPYTGALAVWTAILMAALGVLMLAALRVARLPRDPWRYGIVAAMTISSAPVIGALALGQVALVSAAAVAAGVVAYGARWAPGAFGATLLAALQPNLALPLIARVRSRWDIAVAASAAGAFAILTLVTGGGVSGFLAYLHRLGAHADAERYVAIQHTPGAIAYALGAPQLGTVTLSVVVAIVAAAATVVIIVREQLDATTATLLACATLPLAIPFFHEHDFGLELLPVLVLAVRARGCARGLASVAAVLVLVDWFGFAQRHFAQGQIVCLGLAVALGFVGLGRSARREWQPDFAGLLAIVALTAIALPLGTAHPAPTWPDALPARYHADPAADASAVWRDEGRAAGLTTREPVWGVLRSFPLAGCVVLAAALVADARGRRRDAAASVAMGWPRSSCPGSEIA